MNKEFIIKHGILVDYTGTDKIVIIPEKVNKINDYCFSNNNNIEKIILSSTCKIIGESAFANCTNLKEIELCNVEVIGDDAFLCCCNLKQVELPNTSKYINCIFGNCDKLEKIKFNKKYSEKEISYLVGTNNISLKEVTGPGIICENGVVYNEDKSHLIYYLESKKDEYFKIPDNTTVINEDAFSLNKFLKTLELGKNTKEIKNFGICCDIEKIIINNNLSVLRSNAIISYNLKEIDLTKTKIKSLNITAIRNNSKYNKMIVKLKNETKIMGDETFKDSRIEYVYSKTLEELLNEGKSFREASNIIKMQER